MVLAPGQQLEGEVSLLYKTKVHMQTDNSLSNGIKTSVVFIDCQCVFVMGGYKSWGFDFGLLPHDFPLAGNT